MAWQKDARNSPKRTDPNPDDEPDKENAKNRPQQEKQVGVGFMD